MESRVESGQGKWKEHKQKMISKMYEQVEKTSKKDAKKSEEQQKQEE